MIRVTAVALLIAGLTVVESSHARKSDADQPINIRAQSVNANEKTGMTTYTGNVVVTQGSMRLDAERLEVTTKRGDLQTMRAWGKPAQLRARTDADEEIHAQATRIEYDTTERRIDLHDNALLKRDGDTVQGAIVHYLLDAETFSAEGGDGGQVTAVIQPARKEKRP